jgi:N-acetylglutamate synthase-like GNAT family acetyltransferase
VPDLTVRRATAGDRAAVDAIHDTTWGGPVVVGHGVAYDLRTLPTLVAVDAAGSVLGALAYHVGGDVLEVVSVASSGEGGGGGGGVGAALLTAAADEARGQGLRRLWLITTNDNLPALRFYQRRGMRITAVSPGAVDEARRRKPDIPVTGNEGVELHDELTLELRLDGLDEPAAAGRAALRRHVRGGVLDVWSLLGDPADTADVLRAVAGAVRGVVDAVTGVGEAGLVLAALVARELSVPFVAPGTPVEAVADRRLLNVDAGIAQPPATGGSPTTLIANPEAPLVAVAVLVDQLPAGVREYLEQQQVYVTCLLGRDELSE